MNIAEICVGLELISNAEQKQRGMAMLRRMRRKPLLRITAETGEAFGTIAGKLIQSGRGADFRIQDVWLAAQAVQRGFTLLTANPKDFQDVPDLKLVAVALP